VNRVANLVSGKAEPGMDKTLSALFPGRELTQLTQPEEAKLSQCLLYHPAET